MAIERTPAFYPKNSIRFVAGIRITPVIRLRMRTGFDPFSLLVLCIAGWLNQRQQHVIEYRVEENRGLRQEIGSRRLLFTDDQRRRLAAKAKKLGRKVRPR